MPTSPIPSPPVMLNIRSTGSIEGRSDRYEVHLSRLGGVYSTAAEYTRLADSVDGDPLAYWVDSHTYDDGPGSLTVGTSTLLPGLVGDEFALTRGHIHAQSNRAELYYCLSGRGVMVMDSLDGGHEAIELTPGHAAHVPGHWVHRSVNVATEPFVTLFSYNSDAGQDYEVIANAGGMSQLIVTDGASGWKSIPNPRHRGYRRPKFD